VNQPFTRGIAGRIRALHEHATLEEGRKAHYRQAQAKRQFRGTNSKSTPRVLNDARKPPQQE
jgi:hypothetical protein